MPSRGIERLQDVLARPNERDIDNVIWLAFHPAFLPKTAVPPTILRSRKAIPGREGSPWAENRWPNHPLATTYRCPGVRWISGSGNRSRKQRTPNSTPGPIGPMGIFSRISPPKPVTPIKGRYSRFVAGFCQMPLKTSSGFVAASTPLMWPLRPTSSRALSIEPSCAESVKVLPSGVR